MMSPLALQNKLQPEIAYRFTDPDLFTTALSHRSYLNESSQKQSNERLEFLGDAVLELVITHYLYTQRPSSPEGELTAARSAIVRTESLAAAATNIHLGEFILMSKGEEKSGGRTNPSLLADTFESLIGAIFLDGGYQAASQFIHKILIDPNTKFLESSNFKDPKSLLQEKLQERGFTSPIYQTLSATGPDHERLFTVGVYNGTTLLATGQGKNKQTAQQQAAATALTNPTVLESRPQD